MVVSPIGHYGFFDTSDGPNTVRRPRDILFFGALRTNKGVGLLPAIARRLLEVDPAARLVVAGSRDVAASLRKGSWPGQLDAILDELSKLPNCELHIRFIPDAEVAPLFRRATVVLLPYLEASQSAVAMIGMALGAGGYSARCDRRPDSA